VRILDMAGQRERNMMRGQAPRCGYGVSARAAATCIDANS
jgi:hypothetical protein